MSTCGVDPHKDSHPASALLPQELSEDLVPSGCELQPSRDSTVIENRVADEQTPRGFRPIATHLTSTTIGAAIAPIKYK